MKSETKRKLIKWAVILSIPFILYVTLPLFFPESTKRKLKDFKSEWMGGLDRSCTVYALSGKVIKEYRGHFDIKPSERQVIFDIGGKRVIIKNATVICEEK